jgi:Na+/H+ antiporter NhaC
MDTHPFGWLSLVPSLVAIVLAIATRRVVLSMLLGVAAGAIITSRGNLVQAVVDTAELHLWHSLAQEERLRVFGFTVLMGAMVGIIERAGGMAGLVSVVSRWAHNRSRGQLATWFLGLLVFFDDYANTVLLGNTLQPLCRRLKISKEKLAYLVDSTAAPVAGLAVISTWVAGEIDFVQSGLDSLAGESSVSAFALFIQSIPYRFYVLWSLVFVFLVGWTKRDFGPMLRAEQSCVAADEEEAMSSDSGVTITPSGWWNAVIPIVGTVLAVLGLLWLTGSSAIEPAADGSTPSLMAVFGSADSYLALLWGSMIGLVIAISLTILQRLLSWTEIQSAMAHGAQLMLPALAVLWLASSLSALTGHDEVEGRRVVTAVEAREDVGEETQPEDLYPAQGYRLYTGEYLAGLIGGRGESSGETQRHLAAWMPTIIFLLSGVISFSTGTSWGTMAIVMPVAIPLAFGALVGHAEGAWQTHPVMIGTIASVLAGSIFGDHCSPISDTTVLSSQACGCEHTAHVWTQLPYASLVAGISVLFGTLPAGYGVPVWLLLPLGIAGMFVLLTILGTRVDDV